MQIDVVITFHPIALGQCEAWAVDRESCWAARSGGVFGVTPMQAATNALYHLLRAKYGAEAVKQAEVL